LAVALAQETDPFDRSRLAEALGSAAARLEPAAAARRCAEAARLLADALDQETEPDARPLLAEALGRVAARLEPAEAAALAPRLADALAQADKDSPSARSRLAGALATVAVRIDPGEAAPRSRLAARAVAGWLSPAPQLGQAEVLLQAAEPLPCRFTTQQLVDLLKMPTCVDEARTVILEQLSNRYKRPFIDVWKFVEWAQEHEPGLDFTSPPRRPRPLATQTVDRPE
jgi:hypothetical protein